MTDWKQIARKAFDFAVLCVAVLGLVGNTCYAFYYHLPLFAFANIGVVAMAYPFIKSRLKDLLDN